MSLPFVGASYEVLDGRPSRSRSVNLHLAAMETPAKAAFVLASVPGLVQRASMGGVIRGAIDAGGRCFFVAGSTLYELSATWGTTARGTLSTSTGEVGMAWGLTQLVLVDGANGYTLTLSTNAFARITDEDWPGSATVGYLNGFFTLVDPDSQQAYVTAIDDASAIDALDFVSAERVPDDTVSQICVFGEWWMLGEQSSEVWTAVPSADFPFQRNNGANLEVGCMAAHSVRLIDNGFMMIGRDRNGGGMVYRANGLQLQRVSTDAVDKALQASTDLSAAVAYVYQSRGKTFWCVNAPGVASTWCYEVSTGQWHERCDLDAIGQFAAGRITHTVYSHGATLGGDAAGFVYELSADVHTNAGDPLVRLRQSPNSVTPGRERIYFSEFAADVSTGGAAQGQEFFAELAYSNDGGNTWGNWISRSTGKVGEFFARLLWTRLGAGRDRVWRLRYSGDTPFTIVSGEAR